MKPLSIIRVTCPEKAAPFLSDAVLKNKDNQKEEFKDFNNPIDEDKVTESPGLIEYAHHLGSAIIKPVDRGKVKAVALKSMYKQTDIQLSQIKEQIELLVNQARRIHDRVDISEVIYETKINFKPIVGHQYYLYQKIEGDYFLSLVAPDEWGRASKPDYCATIELLADHTWSILDKSDLFDQIKS
jgi:hypothetical protein